MKKRIIAAIMATATFSLVACNGGNTSMSDGSKDNKNRGYNEIATLEDYESEKGKKKIDIWAYYPDDTENGMKLLKEADVDSILMTRDGEYISTNPAMVKKIIERAARYGVNTMPYTGHIGLDSDDCISAAWLKEYDNIDGLYMYDEPYMDMLPKLGARVPYFMKNYPGKKFVVALHPATVVDHPTWTSDADYEEYVGTYCSKVLDKLDDGFEKILMADCYPIVMDRGQKVVKPSHLYNLAVLAQNAKDHNAKLNLAIQVLDHITYTVPTLEDIRFQVNSLLAFGFDGYTLYTFDTRPSTPYEDNRLGMVKDGEKTEIYDRAKQVNDEIRSFDHVYSCFDWKGVIPVVVNKNEERMNWGSLTSYEGDIVLSVADTKVLSDITTSGNTLCGVFYDNSGNEAFTIMNYANPVNGKTDEVTLKFDDCNKALVYHNGKCSSVDISDNTLTITLGNSEAAFVIPYKNK